MSFNSLSNDGKNYFILSFTRLKYYFSLRVSIVTATPFNELIRPCATAKQIQLAQMAASFQIQTTNACVLPTGEVNFVAFRSVLTVDWDPIWFHVIAEMDSLKDNFVKSRYALMEHPISHLTQTKIKRSSLFLMVQTQMEWIKCLIISDQF